MHRAIPGVFEQDGRRTNASRGDHQLAGEQDARSQEHQHKRLDRELSRATRLLDAMDPKVPIEINF